MTIEQRFKRFYLRRLSPTRHADAKEQGALFDPARNRLFFTGTVPEKYEVDIDDAQPFGGADEDAGNVPPPLSEDQFARSIGGLLDCLPRIRECSARRYADGRAWARAILAEVEAGSVNSRDYRARLAAEAVGRVGG
jgi:hypothetical protein